MEDIDYSEQKENDIINYVYVKSSLFDTVHTIHIGSIKLSKFIADIFNNKKDDYGYINNPIIIKDIDSSILLFIVKYMNFYNNKIEKKEPPFPLPNRDIIQILDDEYSLFEELLTKDIKEFTEYFKSIEYLGLLKLLHKIASIYSYKLKNMSIQQLESIF